MVNRRGFALILVLIALALAGCRRGGDQPPATPTRIVTRQAATLTPTATRQVATATPTGTATRQAATLTPTATRQVATATPSPSPTVTRQAATATPVFPEDEIMTGYASYYAAGVFDEVIKIHRDNGWGRLPEDLTGAEAAAVISCDSWGQTAHVRAVDLDGLPLSEWVRLTVVDCAGDRLTVEWATANNVIIEVDESLFNQWIPLKTVKGLRVQVYLTGEGR